MSNRVPKAIRTLENLVSNSESDSTTTNAATVPIQVKQNIAKLDSMLQSQLAKEFAVGLQCDQEDKEKIYSLKSKLGATQHSKGWKLMLPRGTEDIGFVIPKGRQRISGVPGKGSIYTFTYAAKTVIEVPLNGSWIKNGEIENFRCINCTGTGKVRCVAPLCKKGSIKVRDFGWLDSKQQHWGPTGYHFDPCKNCEGTGLLLCPCCYNSRFKNSSRPSNYVVERRLKLKSVSTELLASSTCPNCWFGFQVENVKWVSGNEELIGDYRLGEDFQQRFRPTRFDVNGNAVDLNGTACQDIACPNCHLKIPRSVLVFRPFFLSIAGTPSCGKSFYLASLAWQLRKTLPSEFNLQISDSDGECNKILNDYEEQLFFNSGDNNLATLAQNRCCRRLVF